MDEKNPVQNVPEKQSERAGKTPFIETVYDWLDTFLVALVVVTLIFTFVFRQVQVEGDSMYDTLQNGDRLLINNIGYTPTAGDIVVIKADAINDKKPIIKRIIATAGQTVDIDFENWIVYVDGKALDESQYIDVISGAVMLNQGGCTYPYVVGEDEVFVMGDNRNNSRDSRYSGAINEKYILGKAFVRLFPFDSIGLI